jgi:hypothetical protein
MVSITIVPKYIEYKKMSWLRKLLIDCIYLTKITFIDYAHFKHDYPYSEQNRVFIKFWSEPLAVKVSLDEKELDLLIKVANDAKIKLQEGVKKK